MKEIKILYLYSDILELYGDHSNIDILKYRIEKRKINCQIDVYNIGDENPNFSLYDIIFIAGGMEDTRNKIIKDLENKKDNIQKAIKEGVFFLLIGQGYEIFGKSYEDEKNNITKCLNIFPYYFKEVDKKYIGNVILNSNLKLNKNEEENNEIYLVGFENHKTEVFDLFSNLGIIKKDGRKEGFFIGNVIGTYLHGPFLSKNPEISDYIIKNVLDRKYEEEIELKNLDDSFEIKAKKEILEREK